MRQFSGKLKWIIAIWAIATVGFHLYTAIFGTLEPRMQRAVHVLSLLPVVYLVFPASKKKESSNPSILDWILAGLAVLPSLYLILNNDKMSIRIEQVTPITTTEFILGFILLILVLEACRRAVSIAFSIVICVLLSYLFIAPHLSGAFNMRELGLSRIVEIMYLSSHDGMYGFLTGISSNIIFVFIIFAAIMVYSGVGDFFMNLSILVAGRFRGGPAKITVFSSALFGSVSGSSVSDIYATGSFSIPLMKKIGYTPVKAGAIEAVSSAGGPLLPPVMGAGAFIMAEMTATPYTEIIKMAVLGAIIYYIGVLSMVHFEAVSMNLKPNKDEKISIKSVLIQTYYILPFGVLLYFLFNGSSPSNSAAYGLIAMLIVWMITKVNRMNIRKLIDSIIYAVQMGTVIISALCGAGIIVSVINQSGLALTLGGVITQFSSGNLLIALILVMITTIFLGAGIPTTAAYIITATISAAALTEYGVPLVAVHLFIFYFAILADITPPVGVTAFSAANVANSPPMKTALFSVKYAFAGFIVPFIFMYNPELLMVEGSSVLGIITIFVISSVSVIALAASIIGVFFIKFGVIERIILAIVAIVNIYPNLLINILMVAIMVVMVTLNYLKSKKETENTTEPTLSNV
ncbi:TRAP transporter permease [Ureibacillus sp. NPDC094379]